MKVFIADIEVYCNDWIFVCKEVESTTYTVIHNDNHGLREFLKLHSSDVFGFFNGKNYDIWILKTILNGGSNLHVKRHNDFIINGGNGWEYEFPAIGYEKNCFKLPCSTFDLRDDISDLGLSLKAIEGNLKLPIVESSIPFDIDRKLTPEELEEVIRYCKYDVDSTTKLYWKRKEDYLDAKVLVGEMYGVPAKEAIGLTNAKLSARVLDAKAVGRTDERNYVIPQNIDVNSIPKIVLDFFLQIRDENIPDAKLFGAGKGSKGMTLDIILKTSYGSCPVTFAWGGVHGAKPCITVEETDDRVIINQDVASLYPNSMINFGFCSRSMSDPDAYSRLVKNRLAYKKAGDKKKADALKLIVNTVYGAMLNSYNDLEDRWAGRSVCISNQLAMTVLIVQLAKQCKTIDFININTDGIMFSIDRKEVELSEKIVAEWSKVTRFEMERDDFQKVIQKDVNNYIGIKPNGKFKTKGSFVKLYKGGDFTSNSLQIIHRAIVDYLVKGIPVETTIHDCKDVFAFQQIVKTGGTFEGSYQYINGDKVPIQKVNRIYAVKNPKYGQIVKGKWITEKRKKNTITGKMESKPVDPPIWSETVIAECPEHCFIDNDNVLTVADLDKEYYINMAKKRVDMYLNISSKTSNKIAKIKEEVVIMAETKNIKRETLNIFAKLDYARIEFLKVPVKKSGINRFAEYKYFELEDIVPVATSIFHRLGLIFLISYDNEVATGTLVNIDNPNEKIVFTSPMRELEVKGMNSIQALGSTETYQRRYLYMTCLDIVEADAFDAIQGKPDVVIESSSQKPRRTATAEEREEAKKILIDECGQADINQLNAIKEGLRKLREKGGEYEPYINESIKKYKGGLTKVDAENMLIEIGKKIAE